jgi:hypothetical protein
MFIREDDAAIAEGFGDLVKDHLYYGAEIETIEQWATAAFRHARLALNDREMRQFAVKQMASEMVKESQAITDMLR